MGESIGRWISKLYRYGHVFIDKKLESTDLRSGHIHFLMVLYKNESISQEQLSKRLGIDKTTTARAIKKLVDMGYIDRESDIWDKRQYRLNLTQKGRNIVPFIYEAVKEWTDILSEGLSDGEKEMALFLLKKMAENAHEYKKKIF